MFRSLIKVIVLLVIGILIYNLFLGDDSEKENARKVFGEIKEVGIAVSQLLKSEKQKFDEGKYDDALDKVGDVFQKMKRQARDIDEKYVDRIAKLEEKRKELEERLEDLSNEEDAIPESYQNDGEENKEERKIARERQKITKELDQLVKETENLMIEMDKEE